MLLLLRVLRLKPSRPSLPRALLLSLSLEMTSRVAAAGADDRERSMMCVHVTCACIAPHTCTALLFFLHSLACMVCLGRWTWARERALSC